MGDNAIDGEDGENGKMLPTDKKPMLDTPASCKGPAFASSRCAAIASGLINEHKHVRVGDSVSNAVHVSRVEYVIPFQGSSRDTFPAKVKAPECAGKGGN